jgi:hypothetical protein
LLDEKLVGSLLPLLVHGVRTRLGHEADEAEEGQAGSQAGEDAPGDARARAGRVGGTGTVRTKGDPVGCGKR